MVRASFAYSLMQHGLANELVLIDMDTTRAEGEAMDLNHGLPFVRLMRIITGDYADLTDAEGFSLPSQPQRPCWSVACANTVSAACAAGGTWIAGSMSSSAANTGVNE